MDPNEALANAREAIEDYESADKIASADDAADRLVASFRALDEWLSRDGFLPDDWRAEEDKIATRPSIEEEPRHG